MKIVCNTASFTEICLNVQRCVPTRSVMPHLEGILIRTLDDDQLKISGFDLDLGITTVSDVRVLEPGAMVLNARTFCDILRHLPGEDVQISCDEKNICMIRSGEVEYTVISLKADEYPELPTVNEENAFRIKQGVFKTMIRQTAFAVLTDDSKAVHRGIKFEISPGLIRLIGLDGYRLAIRNEFIEYNDAPFSFIVSAKNLNEVIKFIPDGEDAFMKITVGSKHVCFTVGDYVMIARRLEGDFLDYKSAVPTAKSTTVRVNTKQMIDCIERTSIIITEKMKSPLKLVIDDDMIRISCVTALGSANDKLDVSIDGKRVEIGFNNRYLLDALRSCETDEVLLQMNGAYAPALILPPEGDAFTYLILPVRI